MCSERLDWLNNSDTLKNRKRKYSKKRSATELETDWVTQNFSKQKQKSTTNFISHFIVLSKSIKLKYFDIHRLNIKQ